MQLTIPCVAHVLGGPSALRQSEFPLDGITAGSFERDTLCVADPTMCFPSLQGELCVERGHAHRSRRQSQRCGYEGEYCLRKVTVLGCTFLNMGIQGAFGCPYSWIMAWIARTDEPWTGIKVLLFEPFLMVSAIYLRPCTTGGACSSSYP